MCCRLYDIHSVDLPYFCFAFCRYIYFLKTPEICYVIAVLNIKINAHHDNMWLILNDLIPLSSNLSYLSPPRFLFETLLYLTLVISLSGGF